MTQKVNQILNGVESRDSLRYFLHSSHDTQVINTVRFLDPIDHDYVDMPFASTLMTELHYNNTCLQFKKDTSCFTVEVYNNGKPLKFDTCLEANKARGSTSPICQFDDYITHLQKRLVKGDLHQKCNTGYDPYPQKAVESSKDSLFLQN